MMKPALFLVSLLCALNAVAAPPTKESIDALLDVTKAGRNLDDVMKNMTRLMEQHAASTFASSPLAAEQLDAMRETQAKVAEVVRQEMSFEKLEPIFVDIYRQLYTQDEVDGLIAFYRTPAGRSYVDKQPEVLQRTFVAMQPLLKETMEKVQAMVKQAAEDAKATAPPGAAPPK